MVLKERNYYELFTAMSDICIHDNLYMPYTDIGVHYRIPFIKASL